MIKTLYAQDEEDTSLPTYPLKEEPQPQPDESRTTAKSLLKENSASRSTEADSTDSRNRRKSNIEDMEESVGDFFFGDAEMDPLSMEFEINHLDGLITQVCFV